MHLLHTPMTETYRRTDGEGRWCFRCRCKRPFEYVITSPIVSCWCPIDGRQDDGEGVVEWSTGAWYGPSTHIECAVCHLVDGDCFPGRWREWED